MRRKQTAERRHLLLNALRGRTFPPERSLFFFFAVFLFPLILSGQSGGPSFTVVPDRTRLMVGDRLTLTLTVEGPNVKYQRPLPVPNLEPYLKLLSTDGPFQQQTYQFINGRTIFSGNVSIRGVFEARMPGSVTVPALQYLVGNDVVMSAPVEILIAEAPSLPQGGPEDGWVPPRDPYLEARPSKTEAYVGEQIVVSYYLYNLDAIHDLKIYQLPTPGDFTMAELGMVSQLNPVAKRFNNASWFVSYLMSFALFPNKAGELELDSLGLNYWRRSSQRDFFGNFLEMRAEVSSLRLKFKIKPLPEEGKPVGFEGAVGRFQIELEPLSGQLKASEQFKFTLTISGTGHPDFIPRPRVELPPGFELYTESADKQINNVQGMAEGVRQFKMILIPRLPGSYELEPFYFWTFEPDSASYQKVESNRLRLTVSPGEEMVVEPEKSEPEALAVKSQDLRFIKQEPIRPGQSRWLLASPLFAALQFLPLLFLAGAFALRRRRDRLSRDVAYARRLRAGKTSRQLLVRARKALAAGDQPAFYTALHQALTSFIADWLNLSAAGMTTMDAVTALRENGVSEAVVVSLEKILLRCDQARFAPGTIKDDDHRALLGEAEQLLRQLEAENRR